MVALAVGRVAATYTTLNQTYDEPAHIAAGLQHLQTGDYNYEVKHPPLARDAAALGLLLAGVRTGPPHDIPTEGEEVAYQEGNEILHQDGRYWRNLTIARVGILPFLAIAVVVTFAWGRRWYSTPTGLWAAAFVASTPPILGHAGVATTDLACAATTVTALYQLLRWIETPGGQRAAWLGLAAAAAFLAKLSSIAFLGLCFAIAVIAIRRKSGWRRRAIDLAIAAGVALVAMWAYYGFSVRTLAAVWGPHPRIDVILSERPWLEPVWETATSVPLPLTEMMIGIRDVNRFNEDGSDSFLLGEYRHEGWWYFFPVALAVKTPLGLLLLSAAGLGLTLWRPRSVPLLHLLTGIFPLAILAVGIASQINFGVRHILPIYPLLALLAGHVVASSIRRRGAAVAAGVLAAWVVVEPAFVHPDYLAYFNPLAGRSPERIVAESDLDWGQDLARLGRRLKERNADRVAVGYFGSMLLDKAGLPPYRDLDPHQPTTGYIAISLHRLVIDNAKDGSYEWLRRHTPVERIGKSIDLFYLTE